MIRRANFINLFLKAVREKLVELEKNVQAESLDYEFDSDDEFLCEYGGSKNDTKNLETIIEEKFPELDRLLRYS